MENKVTSFNLDSAYTLSDIEDKADVTDISRGIIIITGCAIGFIAALAYVIIKMLYLRRRYERSEQEVEDEFIQLR